MIRTKLGSYPVKIVKVDKEGRVKIKFIRTNNEMDFAYKDLKSDKGEFLGEIVEATQAEIIENYSARMLGNLEAEIAIEVSEEYKKGIEKAMHLVNTIGDALTLED